MEDGTEARAFLAKAAATFAVLSLLHVALSGSAPSHASAALRTISSSDFGAVPIGDVPWSTSLFASFTYEHGVAFGTYAQFGYNATTGTVRSLIGLEGRAPVLFLESIDIEGFPPARSAAARGPIFEAAGYLVTITAHDDPTALLEIRSDMPRLVTVELPAWSTNISLVSVPGSGRSSSVSFVVQGEEARLFLGAGWFNVTGTTVFAHLASPDLLVFKSVPAGSTNKAEWRAVLDAISAGHVVSELDLVAIADGGWMQNPGRYRIRSEEHTSELQSQSNLVCRLLLEKKKNIHNTHSLIARMFSCSIHASELEAGASAQIDLVKVGGLRLTHLDNHNHTHIVHSMM